MPDSSGEPHPSWPGETKDEDLELGPAEFPGKVPPSRQRTPSGLLEIPVQEVVVSDPVIHGAHSFPFNPAEAVRQVRRLEEALISVQTFSAREGGLPNSL